jgi:hypothetical protein
VHVDSPDPQLKGAWFQPLHPSSEKTGFKTCPFKCNLYRYRAECFARGKGWDDRDKGAAGAEAGAAAGVEAGLGAAGAAEAGAAAGAGASVEQMQRQARVAARVKSRKGEEPDISQAIDKMLTPS